jgi:acetyltransferase-like isoleucine patch superfamily enzyme
MKENVFVGIKNRIFQYLARTVPGARTLRVYLHRWRGVKIGKDSWVGYDVIIDTGFPDLITIGNRVVLSIGVILVGHFRELRGITIEDDVFIGPGAIILPGIRIGQGSVVTAGSVVTKSIAPMTVVQGNPACPVARCEMPLGTAHRLADFSAHLKPLKRGK